MGEFLGKISFKAKRGVVSRRKKIQRKNAFGEREGVKKVCELREKREIKQGEASKKGVRGGCVGGGRAGRKASAGRFPIN